MCRKSRTLCLPHAQIRTQRIRENEYRDIFLPLELIVEFYPVTRLDRSHLEVSLSIQFIREREFRFLNLLWAHSRLVILENRPRHPSPRTRHRFFWLRLRGSKISEEKPQGS